MGTLWGACVTACVLLGAATWGQIGSAGAVAAGEAILRPRTARWEHEANLEHGPEQFGAEHNPTGNPIGGGEGYQAVVTAGDFTVRTLDELCKALAEAHAGQVVFIPGDVEIDMSGHEKLLIPEGVTLASARGWQGSAGALVYSTAPKTRGLLDAGGDYVRITGLRVRGPDPTRADAPYYTWGLGTTHFGTEIDNCEVSAFAFAGIYVRGGARRAHVHHCFIHHNQQSGLGYGVAVDEADVLVEANRIDWCRHYITGANGNPGTGYEARYNVCGPNANGHLFDMHGQASGSGIAGDWMNIHHNTVLCTEQVSIGIRGTPSQGAIIHHNWFYNPRGVNALFVLPGGLRTLEQVRALMYVAELVGEGNVHAYRNVFGEERRLISKFCVDDSALAETKKRLEGTPLSDLVDIARIQRQCAPMVALGETPAQQELERLDGMSKEELVGVITDGLERVRQASQSQPEGDSQ